MATGAAKLGQGGSAAPASAGWLPRAAVSMLPPIDTDDQDRDLLTRALRFEAAALASIHDRYFRQVFRYLLLRTGDQHLAEDLAGEVFVRFMEALGKAARPPDSLRGWLFGVAAHVWADQQRRSFRQTRLAPRVETAPAAAPQPEQAAEHADMAQRLVAAMEGLTPERREVLSLRFVGELPIRDVALSLGKTEGAVKQLQARAVATLGRLMSGEG